MQLITSKNNKSLCKDLPEKKISRVSLSFPFSKFNFLWKQKFSLDSLVFHSIPFKDPYLLWYQFVGKESKNPEAQTVTVQISNRKQCNFQKNMHCRNQRTKTLFFWDFENHGNQRLKQCFRQLLRAESLKVTAIPWILFIEENWIQEW